MTRKPKPDSLKPRKTGIQTRATKTVEAIVEAAARILETAGLEGYTTNAVAQRAGVSIGSLYQYFPNKDAITLALIARETATLLHEVTEAVGEPDWEAAVQQMIGAAVRHQLRRPVLARLLDVEEARLPVMDEAAPGSGAIYAIVRQVIANAAQDQTPEVDFLTCDVIGMTRGMTDMAGKRGEIDEVDLSARVARAVLGYLMSTLNHTNFARSIVG